MKKRSITLIAFLVVSLLLISCGVVLRAKTITSTLYQGVICVQPQSVMINSNGNFQDISSCLIPGGLIGIGQCFHFKSLWEHVGTKQVGYRLVMGSTAITGTHYSSGNGDTEGYGIFESTICNNQDTQQSQFAMNSPRSYGNAIFFGSGFSTATENLALDTTIRWQFIAPLGEEIQSEGIIVNTIP